VVFGCFLSRGFMTKQSDELYDEMCRVVGDVVFTLHD